MINLFVFGLGYSALHLVRSRALLFSSVAGTVRSEEKARALENPRLMPLVFGGADAAAHLAHADVVLVSVPPGEHGDPALAAYRDMLASAPRLRQIIYLSTIGVYGDCAGAWVDEMSPAQPGSTRSRQRLAAEKQWMEFAAQAAKRLDILRIAGIYGPGRNALVNLREGTARRIIKPDQVFNRIHVEDIAQAIEAAMGGLWQGGIVNLCDDEPAPPQDVVAFAAGLMGIEPPPETPYDEAAMTPMARSFYEENKRVSNRRLRELCRVKLAYPNYREGLRALLAQGEGR